jgi:hypothetical protein
MNMKSTSITHVAFNLQTSVSDIHPTNWVEDSTNEIYDIGLVSLISPIALIAPPNKNSV